ncbi:ABC transporter ATP-binding protein [Azospirillum thermophilum]|uniref:ABC transporter ATP-binding protein n=1 Tax=Azospirillum thermophilum TaxID=2202148 RepID=A0A2S2CM86_9PROT|nr:ABC transporter ATP-binding protein [Azospirillum thermophilum]AWK85614.1 ABC transporter ATP-binding protein [Azospirillum thermophilum]
MTTPPASPTTTGRVSITDVSHHYGRHQVLAGVSLTVEPQEVVCILGPSGCGKSTLLRLVSGLETLQAGSIAVGDTLLAEAGYGLPPERRPVGMMFQDFALFPHLTVAGNIEFGQQHRPRAERRRRTEELLAMVNLSDYAGSYPHMLSGGQQQRVALARAMARDPAVLLLDEPFSALDEQLRRSVREEVVRLIRATGVATLVVTHDPEEAMEIGSRVVVMADGRVVQADTPRQLYRNPANSFVARLFGEVNRFEATVDGGELATPFGRIPAPALSSGTRVEVACRIEDLELAPAKRAPDGLRVRVRHANFLGASTRVCLDALGPAGEPAGGFRSEIHARLPGLVEVTPGEELVARVEPRRLMVFPAA